jgi:hypothetical protein
VYDAARQHWLGVRAVRSANERNLLASGAIANVSVRCSFTQDSCCALCGADLQLA